MSNNFNLDLQGIVRNAMRKAGLLDEYSEPDPAQVQMGGEFLNLQLKEWQAAGKMLRQTERTTTLVDATARTTGVMPIASDTIDVEFPIALTLSSGTQTYIVNRQTRADWLTDTQSRNITGIPTHALIERSATVAMTLFPIPDSSVVSVEYVRVKLISDILVGENAEVLQRMINAVVLGLAVDFADAKNKDDAKIARLQARYEQAKAGVFIDNIEKGNIKFSVR
jgi:hypothetical protein